MTFSMRSQRSAVVASWLFACAAMIFVLILVGGATRLVGAGLAITEWAPIRGALPPLSDDAWSKALERYRAIPQYSRVNFGMSLAEFKTIFWWEWAHRALARAIGVLFFVPLLWYLVSREIPRRLILPCLLVLVLGASQALVGWWMVASGLSARVDVAAERLALHLGLGVLLLSAILVLALEAAYGPSKRPLKPEPWSAATVALVFAQIVLGALVAGNDAGSVHRDWPLMGGSVFPADYLAGGSFLTSLVSSPAATQFNHRAGAYLLLALVWFCALRELKRSTPASRVVAGTSLVLAAATTAQAIVGVATLIFGNPGSLAMLHHGMAPILLACATALAWVSARSDTRASWGSVR